MYQSLLAGKVFHIENIYEHLTDLDEILYGRAGLALLIRYFQDKGLKFSDPDVL